jgi:hypothetical protein
MGMRVLVGIEWSRCCPRSIRAHYDTAGYEGKLEILIPTFWALWVTHVPLSRYIQRSTMVHEDTLGYHGTLETPMGNTTSGPRIPIPSTYTNIPAIKDIGGNPFHSQFLCRLHSDDHEKWLQTRSIDLLSEEYESSWWSYLVCGYARCTYTYILSIVSNSGNIIPDVPVSRYYRGVR